VVVVAGGVVARRLGRNGEETFMPALACPERTQVLKLFFVKTNERRRLSG
jgi:hypothetical protein